MKKKTVIEALILAGVFLISSCGGSSVNYKVASDKSENSSSKDLTQVSIGVSNNSVASISQAIAYSAGFFEEEGINPDLVPVKSVSEGIEELSKDNISWYVGGSTLGPLLADEAGDDFVVISGEMAEGAALVALPENIQDLKKLDKKHLQGKKVGTIRATTGDIAFRYFLQKKDISLDDVEIIEYADAYSVIQAVLIGEIDVGNVFASFRQKAEEEGLEVVAHVDELFPGVPCCRTWVRREELKKNRDIYVRLVRAQIKGYRVYKNNPDLAINYGKKYIELDDIELEEQLYDYGHLSVSPNPNKNAIIKFYKAAVKDKFAEGSIDVKKYIDISIYKDAIESLMKEEPDDEVYNELYNEFNSSL